MRATGTCTVTTDGIRVESAPTVDLVIPVHNQAAMLGAAVREAHDYLRSEFPFTWLITIVDQASTDDTWSCARALSRELPRVRSLRVDRHARGLALRTAWSTSDAAVLAHADADTASTLKAFLPLVAPLISGHSQVAVGSRFASGSRVVCRARREVVSRAYNRLLRLAFRNTFHDAQFGFKAIRADVARRLLPEVRDEESFFDTELLLLAERSGLRITEIPVDWMDEYDGRFTVIDAFPRHLKGMIRLRRRLTFGRGTVHVEDIGHEPITCATVTLPA